MRLRGQVVDLVGGVSSLLFTTQLSLGVIGVVEV